MSSSTGAYLNMGGNNIVAVANMTITNKLTVSTIDPLYKINGINYSTFVSSIVGGTKEEYTGKITIDKYVDEEYEAVINFAKLEEGNDLWVWRKVVDFSKENVEVAVTPYGGFAQVYYLIEGNNLIFRADKPIEISYRLVGRRYDWKKWPTKAIDQTETPSAVINSY